MRDSRRRARAAGTPTLAQRRSVPRGHPKVLVMVDLPVDERDAIYQGGSSGEPVVSELGPVEFAFHSMVDLGRYDDGSFDLVYSGQSIEHVSDADGEAVVREAFRVLVPGGWFCLDTPNGPLWRLRSDAPMNHYHKIEYAAGELVAKVTQTQAFHYPRP